MSEKLTPRPYQAEDLDRIETAYQDGKNRLLYHGATGMGKGVLASFLPRQFPRLAGEGVLVLVPRREIAFQMRDNFAGQYPSAKVGIEMGSRYADGDEDILIASSHTLGRRDSDRIERWLTEFGIIINDEAHHTYSGGIHDNVLAWFGQGAELDVELAPGIDPLVVHMTATPEREDEHTLAPFVDHVLPSRDIKFGIENGWLVPISAHKVTEAPTGGVEDMDGYEADLMVRAYEEFGLGGRMIVFAPSVDVARLAMRRFEQRGTPAGFVSGDECALRGEEATRNEVIEAHKSGEIRVITNFGVLVEGYDDPALNGLVMGRDLSSRRLYTQIMGRALRPACAVDEAESADERREMIAGSEKPAARIVDVGENVDELQLQVTAPNVLGVDQEMMDALSDGDDDEPDLVLDVVDEIDELDDEQPERDLRDADPDEIRLAAQEVDVWSQTVYNDRLKSFSPLRWIKWGDPAHLALYVPVPPEDKRGFRHDKRKTIVYLRPTGDDEYDVLRIDTGGSVKHFRKGWFAKQADAEQVTSICKSAIPDYMAQVERRLREKDADAYAVLKRGRDVPATDEQIEDLEDAGFSVRPDEVTSATADLLLDYHEIERKIDLIAEGEQGSNRAKELLN